MKLTKDDKLKIFKLYDEGHGCTILSRMFKVNESTIKRLIEKYKIHGLTAADVLHKNNKYSTEFKINIINRAINGESINAIANEYLMAHGIIFKWLKIYNELGYNGFKEKPKGRPKTMKVKNNNSTTNSVEDKDRLIAELKEKNKQLEMENELLKKLDALVQERIKQEKKKK